MTNCRAARVNAILTLTHLRYLRIGHMQRPSRAARLVKTGPVEAHAITIITEATTPTIAQRFAYACHHKDKNTGSIVPPKVPARMECANGP